MQNLEGAIYLRSKKIGVEYEVEVHRYGESTQRKLLIISACGASILVISSAFLLPIMYVIEKNLGESLKLWLYLPQVAKEEQLARIQAFRSSLITSEHKSFNIEAIQSTFNAKREGKGTTTSTLSQQKSVKFKSINDEGVFDHEEMKEDIEEPHQQVLD